MKVLLKKFVVVTTILSFCALLSSASKIGKKIKKELSHTLPKANGNDYPVICKQYHVFRHGDDVKDLAKEFRTSISGLKRLNPDLDDIFSADVGMPLCVVGRMSKVVLEHEGKKKREKKRIGKRPRNLVKFQTTPGIDTCNSILQNSDPPLSNIHFYELNPALDCPDMEKKSLKLFLPEGTSITKSSQIAVETRTSGHGKRENNDQDCLMGPWSEWSTCENGEKKRSRNVYEEASGQGKACSASSQTKACNDSVAAKSSNASRFLASSSSSNQCINKGYDGCSNPAFDYRILNPSCNFHDLCWACRDQWKVHKLTCDHWFYELEINTCDSYWRNSFDKGWCHLLAGLQYEVVKPISPSYDYPGTCPSMSTVLNFKLSGRYIGYVVPHGCDCDGSSCNYRGEPFPCWSKGTICGAETTCNNCCGGYSWWWSKFFTACD